MANKTSYTVPLCLTGFCAVTVCEAEHHVGANNSCHSKLPPDPHRLKVVPYVIQEVKTLS